MKSIYLDNASTTRLDGRVLEKMLPYLTENYGNANSVHALGRNAVKGLDEAREIVASILNCDFNEVYFTSGGTEGDNWALEGFTKTRKDKKRLVISSIEHSAMLKKAEELSGIELVKVKPNSLGVCEACEFEKVVDNGTYLVSLMLANNEVGTYQPIEEVAKIAHAKGAYFFTDAVQAMGDREIDVLNLGVDMLSFSAHKFNGPKGVGAVYIKNGTQIGGLVLGGHQEREKRGGTSNVAGAIGLAYALKYNRESLAEGSKYVKKVRDYFIDRVLSLDIGAKLNGGSDRLNNNANVLFKGVNGEKLLFNLDIMGVCASLGAACSAGSIDPSHVLTEMGLGSIDAKSSIRFTFSKENTFEEVDRVIEIIKGIIKK